MTDLATWAVTARNLPEHARNPIHTDAGAQAAGFPRALVAGVTTYAYLCHPPMAAWGLDWVANGGGEVRFRRPVFDGDLLRCTPVTGDGPDAGVVVEARTDEPEQPRAMFAVQRHGGPLEAMRDGEDLEPFTVVLDGDLGADYAGRAGDDLGLCEQHRVVHPGVWPALANQVMHTQLVRGSWIHTRSIVRHHSLAPVGSTAEVRSRVVRRFTAHGERAVIDVHIAVDSAIVASLEHEAIIELP
jgi:acyl dehydratase